VLQFPFFSFYFFSLLFFSSYFFLHYTPSFFTRPHNNYPPATLCRPTHHVTLFPLQFDWNVTRNENMADISGLQIAYSAWRLLQEGETADPHLPGIKLNTRQLFFLSAAQVNVHDDFTHRRSGATNRTVPRLCLILTWEMLCMFHSSQDDIKIFLFLPPNITWGYLYIYIYLFIYLFAAYSQRCQEPILFIINRGDQLIFISPRHRFFSST
jgi:hypothetical protein